MIYEIEIYAEDIDRTLTVELDATVTEGNLRIDAVNYEKGDFGEEDCEIIDQFLLSEDFRDQAEEQVFQQHVLCGNEDGLCREYDRDDYYYDN